MLDITSVLSKSMLCLVAAECMVTADFWLFSLVSLMCSDILVEMWWSVWPMYTVP
jgi:hypothetical protein